MGTLEDERWYVRARGFITGPFSLAQLDSLRRRGVLARFHEVSNDRVTWMKASSLTSLFPDPATARRDAAAPSSPAAAQAQAGDKIVIVEDDLEPAQATFPVAGAENQSWYYVVNGERVGPVGYPELHQAAGRGELGADDLVWTEGLPAWIAARDAPGLPFSASARLAQGARGDAGPQAAADGAAGGQAAGSARRTSRLAVASLVLALMWLGGVGSLLATIFGYSALGQIERAQGALGGRGMAQAGLVLGIVGLVADLVYALAILSVLPALLHA